MSTTQILYVDDRETNRYMTTRQLQRHGFEVIEASTGAEALKKLSLNPDCVLLDVNLPDISGFEVCRQIKASPQGVFLPVVMLSASFIDDKDKIEGLEGGADAYLTQPIDFSVIVATIKALLRARKAEKELVAAAEVWQKTFESLSDGICILNLDGITVQCNQRMEQHFGKTNLINTSIFELVEVFPREQHPFERVKISNQRQSAYAEHRGRWLRVVCDPVFDTAQQLYRVVCTVTDVTEERLAQAALRDASTALNSTLKLSEVLDRILESIDLVVTHETADIMLVEDENISIVRRMGFPQAQNSPFALMESPLFQRIYRTQQPVVIDNLQEQHHEPHLVYNQARSYVGIPILWQGQVVGFLNVTSTEANYFTPQHIDHLKIFANQAAAAIQNARLYEQSRQAASLEERQRLSRDLHDAVSQLLFASSTLSEALTRQSPSQANPERLKEHLERLHRLNRGALAEMRTLLIELRLEELKEIDLGELLQQLQDAIMGRTRLNVKVTLSEHYTLPKDMQVMFYRIAQEALNNIVKHARATQVEITLKSNPRQVELAIRDNGRGFDPQHVNWQSMGLNIMRERAKTMGVSLHIKSAIGSGTSVVVIWQKDQQAEPEFSLTSVV